MSYKGPPEHCIKQPMQLVQNELWDSEGCKRYAPVALTIQTKEENIGIENGFVYEKWDGIPPCNADLRESTITELKHS